MQDEQAQQPEDVADLTLDQDPLLVVLVRLAHRELEMGMTLTVGGLLVSGTLVGGRKYFEGVANQFRNAPGGTPGVGAAVAEAFDGVAVELYGSRTQGESNNDGEGDEASEQDLRIGFIHLRDVRVLDPQGHSATGAWWRGRLSAVDGFMFGTPT